VKRLFRDCPEARAENDMSSHQRLVICIIVNPINATTIMNFLSMPVHPNEMKESKESYQNGYEFKPMLP
jgi:hypothetical protein